MVGVLSGQFASLMPSPWGLNSSVFVNGTSLQLLDLLAFDCQMKVSLVTRLDESPGSG